MNKIRELFYKSKFKSLKYSKYFKNYEDVHASYLKRFNNPSK